MTLCVCAHTHIVIGHLRCPLQEHCPCTLRWDPCFVLDLAG